MSTVINMEISNHDGNSENNSYRSALQNQCFKKAIAAVDLKNGNAGVLCKLRLRFLSGDDIMALKELCNEWFPIKYPDSWYKLIAYDKKFYSIAATIDGKIIAVLIAEIKPRWQVPKEDGDLLSSSFPQDTKVAYILSLGVHRPYRRQGVASFLLRNFLATTCTQENAACQEVKAIYLHVLSSNQVAIQFYERHKFHMLHFLPAYYIIDGIPKDGFSYVLHINGGKPQGKCLDYFYDSFKLFRCLRICKLSSQIFLRINNMLRYYITWPSLSPFVSKSRQCRNL